MSLPVVTEEISDRVVLEWQEIPDDLGVIDYAAGLLERLRQTNPGLVPLFKKLLANRAAVDWDLHVLRVVYACRVYRMLELAGAMVVVSHEAAAPVYTEFLRDHNTYGQAIIDKLRVENPEILNTASPLIQEFEERNDNQSVSRILVFGLLLYKIIESQKKANDLADSLESFGSDT